MLCPAPAGCYLYRPSNWRNNAKTGHWRNGPCRCRGGGAGCARARHPGPAFSAGGIDSADAGRQARFERRLAGPEHGSLESPGSQRPERACLPGAGSSWATTIPYQPWALAKKAENLKNRESLDPLNKCYLPGVPRITYLPFPFRINQTPAHIAHHLRVLTHAYRMIFTNGTKHPEALEFWMGDSRGRWEGDTLVVDVADFNDQTWFDRAGNFHSDGAARRRALLR